MGCVFVMRAMMHVLNVPQFLGSRVILTFIVRGCTVFEGMTVGAARRNLVGEEYVRRKGEEDHPYAPISGKGQIRTNKIGDIY